MLNGRIEAMSLYALNLFDLADNEDYIAYSRRSPRRSASTAGA